jgi:hypothetical protein
MMPDLWAAGENLKRDVAPFDTTEVAHQRLADRAYRTREVLPEVPPRSPGPDRRGAAQSLECSGIRRHAAFGCWQGNGINLAMLSTARHEDSPRPAQ